MPLVKAQCPNCLGVLDIDSTGEAAICPFCGTPYIVEKAINRYTVHNRIEVRDANINLTGDDIEKMLKDADGCFRLLHDKAEAKTRYEEITRKFPLDYRGWWGLTVVETDGLTAVQCPSSAVDSYNKARAVADDEEKASVESAFKPYYDMTVRYQVLSGQLLPAKRFADEIKQYREKFVSRVIIAAIFAILGIILTIGWINSVAKVYFVMCMFIVPSWGLAVAFAISAGVTGARELKAKKRYRACLANNAEIRAKLDGIKERIESRKY